MTERQPFFTGSRRYGTPTKESDLDLVVRCDSYVAAVIEAFIGKSSGDYDHNSISVQCGQVNLHLCTSDKEYDRWRRGSRSCDVVAPIDRETATKLLQVAGVDRGGVIERGAFGLMRGPGKLPPLQEDGTITTYRQWMGWDRPPDGIS